MVPKKRMARYFILSLFILMGIMVSGVALATHGVEDPNSDGAWFTSQPPALLTDIPSATLVTYTKSLKTRKTVYFNLYVDYISSGVVKFYVIDNDGVKVECTINVDCVSSILDIQSPGFTICWNPNLLTNIPLGYPADLSITNPEAASWRISVVACSDPDTCEGKITSLFANAQSLNLCRQSFAGYSTDSAGVPLKSPIFIRFYRDGVTVPVGSGNLEEILNDFTIGIKITGTSERH